MKSIEGLVPNITGNVVTKILFVELYFLLRSGKSPAYFALTDFVDNYSIELLYITVLLTLLSGWIFPIALSAYIITAGLLSFLGRCVLSSIRYMGIPLFKALLQNEREKRVSINIAKSFAHANSDTDLMNRIEAYDKEATTSLEHEANASANFALILMIAWVSHTTGSPNFIMKITDFVDPYLFGSAYYACLILLIIQGIIGRASGFNKLFSSGTLPEKFFKNEEERTKVASWTNSEIERHFPLAQKWMNNLR